MTTITNPKVKRLAAALRHMQTAVGDCEEKTHELVMAGSGLPETPDEGEDGPLAVRTGTAAGTALLNVAVAMLIHPGRRTSEDQDRLAAIGQAASGRPRYETILAMCRLLRDSMAGTRTPMDTPGRTSH